MKIQVEKGEAKPLLPDGRYNVEITDIEEGASEHQNIPFFAARFENDEGYVTQRFYDSPAGKPTIIALYETVGIKPQEGKALDTRQLVGKKLSVLVGDRTYNDPATGNERTIRQATEFQPA